MIQLQDYLQFELFFFQCFQMTFAKAVSKKEESIRLRLILTHKKKKQVVHQLLK